MSKQKKTVTMYMHLLDGQPAVFCDWHSDDSEHYIGYASKRVRFTDLRASLRQIRREQAIACTNAFVLGKTVPHQLEYANRHRYGYVRVEVPRHG